jgi:hypothetical protein
MHGPLDVRVHVLDGPLDRRHDVTDPGEVEHIIGAADEARFGNDVADICFFERQIRICLMMGKIGYPAAAEIIDHAHAIAVREQDIHHVAADEPGATGHHSDRTRAVHFAPSFFIVRTL